MLHSKNGSKPSLAGPLITIIAALVPQAVHAGLLYDMLGIAVDSDPRFQAAIYQYESTVHAGRAVRGGLFPTLDLVYRTIDTSQNIVRSDNAVFGQGETSFPTTNMTIQLRQPLFRWELWQAKSQADAAVRQAEREFVAEQQALILRLAERYLGVLAALDGLDLAISERETIERNLELVEARRASGMADRMDVFDARARASVAQVQELEAHNTLDDARMALAEVIGAVPANVATLSEEIPLTTPEPADEQAWVEAAMMDNVRLQAAMEAIEVAMREMRVRQGGHYPSLDLIYTQNDNDTEGTLFGGGSQVQTTDMAIQLNVPLYAGGSTQARVREAASLLSVAQEERNLLQRQTARETRAAFNGATTGARKVESLAESMVAQQGSVESKERGYRAGRATMLDILDAERDYYRIRREYLQSRYDYLLDSLRLKAATGRLSEVDLAAIDALLVGSVASDGSDAGASLGEAVPDVLPSFDTSPTEDDDEDEEAEGEGSD